MTSHMRRDPCEQFSMKYTMQLLIAAFAIGLCIFERARERKEKAEIKANIAVDKEATKAAPRYHA